MVMEMEMEMVLCRRAHMFVDDGHGVFIVLLQYDRLRNIVFMLFVI